MPHDRVSVSPSTLRTARRTTDQVAKERSPVVSDCDHEWTWDEGRNAGSSTCRKCGTWMPISSIVHSLKVLLEEARRDREEAMRALSLHNGRSWCAVCGFRNEVCSASTPNCLGARARRIYPRTAKSPVGTIERHACGSCGSPKTNENDVCSSCGRRS